MALKLTQRMIPSTLGTTMVEIRPIDWASKPSPMQTGCICSSDTLVARSGRAVAAEVEIKVVSLNDVNVDSDCVMIMGAELVIVRTLSELDGGDVVKLDGPGIIGVAAEEREKVSLGEGVEVSLGCC